MKQSPKNKETGFFPKNFPTFISAGNAIAYKIGLMKIGYKPENDRFTEYPVAIEMEGDGIIELEFETKEKECLGVYSTAKRFQRERFYLEKSAKGKYNLYMKSADMDMGFAEKFILDLNHGKKNLQTMTPPSEEAGEEHIMYKIPENQWDVEGAKIERIDEGFGIEYRVSIKTKRQFKKPSDEKSYIQSEQFILAGGNLGLGGSRKRGAIKILTDYVPDTTLNQIRKRIEDEQI